MKLWIWMLVLFIAVTGLCVWDGIHTEQVFKKLEAESNEIYTSLLTEDISNQDIQNKILNLNKYWTKKMDILCISISRKDLQPVSDYLQYLSASITNNSQEDAITYSRILHYNIEGLYQANGISWENLL